MLGNFPQGFSHLALIRSALNLGRAEAAGPEEHASGPAERSEETERAGRETAELKGRGRAAESPWREQGDE